MNLNKPKMIMTMGIPGSGKSTWSKQFQKENPNFIRINNDELRESLFGNIFDKKDTGDLNYVRERMIIGFLQLKKNMIIDNTNVSILYHEKYKEYCFPEYDLEIKDFSDVPIEICLQRNKERGREVPENIIRSMYQEMMKTKEKLNENKI